MKFVEINIRKGNNEITVHPLPSLISSNHMNPNTGCRPFIGLSGTFLKGFYGGQLLTAISQDANNQIFPIAYAVVDSKTRDK